MKQQCKMFVTDLQIKGVRHRSRKGRCIFPAVRLARSPILTGGRWVAICARHLELLGEREERATTRPLKSAPLNRPPLLSRGAASACELFSRSAIADAALA
jgi:hypothetical protein